MSVIKSNNVMQYVNLREYIVTNLLINYYGTMPPTLPENLDEMTQRAYVKADAFIASLDNFRNKEAAGK